MTDPTIHEDVAGIDSDEGVFLRKFEQAADLETEASETEGEVEETEAEIEAEADEVESEAEEIEASDDAVVRVKAGDKELKLTVSELKRLAGQEAELTRKSQAVAEVTKRAEAETEKALHVMDAMIKQVEAQWKENGFDKIDLNIAATKLPEDAYRILKADMQRLSDQHRFLRQEGEALVERTRQARAEDYRKAESTVDATIAQDVPGWSKAMRSEVVAYAKGLGLDAADSVVAPAALKLMHKAMLYDRGMTNAKAKVKPVASSSPKATLKPGVARGDAKQDPHKTALARLRKSGSIDDAADAFLSRFGG